MEEHAVGSLTRSSCCMLPIVLAWDSTACQSLFCCARARPQAFMQQLIPDKLLTMVKSQSAAAIPTDINSTQRGGTHDQR